MNHYASPLIYVLAVASVFGAVARSDEATPTKDVTVDNLADALYKPGYERFLRTRDRLRMIVKEGPSEQAREAEMVLRTYAKNADRWLLEVGNTADWQVSTAKELPLGQGRRWNWSEFATDVNIHARGRIPIGEMAYIYSFGRVDTVSISGQSLTDHHLRYLSGLKELVVLGIRDTNVSGSFLAHVDLPALKCLHITNSPVRDESLPNSVVSRLVLANFAGTLITNATIRRISMDEIQELVTAQ